jgi:hypothetical protein
MAKRKCSAITKAGGRCRAAPLRDKEHCLAHDAEARASTGFSAEAGKLGGRPRLPRPHEVMREKVEADIEKWLKPYEDGLQAMRPVVIGNGPGARREMVPTTTPG